MKSFNLQTIIDKLNLYLDLNNRSMILHGGYCHGLILLWLYEMSIDNEQWFYRIVKKIAGSETAADFNEMESDIELFISHIEWLQTQAHIFAVLIRWTSTS